MRVLMIAQSSYNYDARIVRYCKTLREIGAKIDVICLQYGNQNKIEEIEGIKLFRIMKMFNQDNIISYIFFSLIFLIKSFFFILRLMITNEYSFVHIHNMPDYLVFSAFPLKLKGVPVLLDVHDLTFELFKEKWSDRKFAGSVLKLSEKLSCNFADQIITVTQECVDRLVSRGIRKNKITLIMNSPDTSTFNFDTARYLRKDKNCFKILYNGTVAKRFGLHYTIKALKYVIAAIPEFEFHIYGNIDNDYTKELMAQTKILNLNGNIFFHPLIPYQEVNDLIKSFDIAIVTYENSEYMNLAFPTKAGEYALTGLPFIMSDLGSVRNIFSSDSVVYVNPEDPEKLSSSIINLYDNPEYRKSLSYNAYKDVQKISWKIMSKRYLDLVYGLTHSRSSAEITNSKNRSMV